MSFIKIQRIAMSLFLVTSILIFIYTLGFMTEFTVMNTYANYLDPNVKTIYQELLVHNNLIFPVAVFNLIFISCLLFYDIMKEKLYLRGFVWAVIAVTISFISQLIFLIRTSELLRLFHALDLSWPSSLPFTGEQLGYSEPSNLWLSFGVYTYGFALIITSFFMLVVTLSYVKHRKS